MSQQYQRNPAVRLLAAELNKSDYHFQETDEERAPNFLLLPSGGKANRVMMGGTLMEVENTSGDSSNPYWKARINDGTGEFLAFAGQYQPEAASVFQQIANDDSMPPAFALMVGKTREYRPEEEESEVIVNLQPNTVSIVDEEERDTWLRDTINSTISRLEQSEGEYVRRAEDRYGNRANLLKDDLLEALENLED